MRISDWSSDVSSSDLRAVLVIELGRDGHALLTQGIDDLFHRLLELPDLDGSLRRLANFRAACGYRDIRGNRLFSLGPPNHLTLGLSTDKRLVGDARVRTCRSRGWAFP